MHQKGDLSRLFSSNDAPTSLEKATIQAKLDDFDRQLAGLRHQLQELEKQDKRYRVLVSPLRALPLEIIREILFAASMENGQRSASTVVTLSLVCKSWRRAALVDHRIWAALSVCVEGDRPSFSKITNWLGRSGTLPKSFDFTADHEHSGVADSFNTCSECGQVLARLLTDGPTLDALTLTFDSSICFTSFLASLHALQSATPGLTTRPWDSLNSLFISMCAGCYQLPPTFSDLPPLKTFKVRLPDMADTFNNSAECENHNLRFPPRLFVRLTRLSISIDWTVTHLLSILEQCSQLESLTVGFQGHPVVYPANPVSREILTNGILLPRLRKFCLKHVDGSCLLILPLLRAPLMRQLEVDFYWFDHAFPFESLDQWHIDNYWLPFALRHYHLQHVRIYDSDGQVHLDSPLRQMFVPFPSLTSLSFENAIFKAEALFSEDTPGDNQEQLFPKLETLELLGVEPSFDIDQVFDFMGAPVRPWTDSPIPTPTRPMHACIKKLNITFRSPAVDTSIENNFRYRRAETSPLVAKGVDVQVGPKYSIV